MYGKDVAENFITMITFCDGGTPQILEALTDKNSLFNDMIPAIQEPWYFEFNSSALYQNNVNASDFKKTFWEIGNKSFQGFINKLRFLPRKSLILTKIVLQEREKLEYTIISLQPELQVALSMRENIRSL